MRYRKFVLVAAIMSLGAAAHAQGLVDPTRPYEYTPPPSAKTGGTATPSGPVLQSILVAPTRRFAIIDGQRVKIGDTVYGATVTAIEPYEVRLERDGRETSLRLTPKLAKNKGNAE